jgi:hypothetical protein
MITPAGRHTWELEFMPDSSGLQTEFQHIGALRASQVSAHSQQTHVYTSQHNRGVQAVHKTTTLYPDSLYLGFQHPASILCVSQRRASS